MNETYVALRVKFDEKPFSLEANFSDFCPTKGIYFGIILEYNNAHVRYSQVQRNSLMVLILIYI